MNINDFKTKEFVDKYFKNELVSYDDKNIYNQVEYLIKQILTNEKHILNDFPLELFFKEDIEKFILHIFNAKDIMNERELISKINKINVDYNLSSLYIKSERSIDENLIQLLGLDFEEICFTSLIFENRSLIRSYTNIELLDIIDELIARNEYVKYEFRERISMFYRMGLDYKNFQQLSDYIEYILDGILQIINYCIIQNELIIDKSKYLDDIELMLENVDREFQHTINNMRKYKLGKLDIYKSINIFVQYLNKRNNLLEYKNILDLLKLEQEDKQNKELFKEVSREFIVEKEILNDIEEVYKMENVITENIKRRDFKKEIEKVQEMIFYFGQYGGRNVHPYCIKDLKVFYREIFMSKSKYKIQARKIVNNFIEDCKKEKCIKEFEKKSEYMFLREKLSRGYFREDNLLKYYNKKNEIQKKLNNLFLKMYLIYDYDTMFNYLFEYNTYILNLIRGIFVEYY